MKIRTIYIDMLIVCWAAVALTGCSRSPRVTFYSLEAASTPEPATPGMTSVSVAVGPVTLPQVVDRPQLVLRVGANRVDILEIHRWASPLKSEIPRIIAANLADQLASARVSAYPQNASENTDYTVLIDVQRFEATPGESVTVDALWSVRRTGGGPPRAGRSVVSEKAVGENYDVLVSAYGRAIAAVSSDIAQAIRIEVSTPLQRP